MNRIIKFRCWDRVHQKMYDGNNIIGPKADMLVSTNMPIIFRLNEFLYELSKQFTLMQFLNFKDQNKKEVFEGDIVNRLYGDGTDAGNQVVEREGDKDELDKYKSFEIVGNIYENPSLLNNK